LGLLAGGGCLDLAGRNLGLVFGLLLLKAFLGPRLNLGLGLCDGHKPIFAALDLLRKLHAVRDRRAVGRRSQLE
jgi:hypothetical protein